MQWIKHSIFLIYFRMPYHIECIIVYMWNTARSFGFIFFQIFNPQSAHFQWRQTKLIFVSAEHYIIHSQSQSQLHTNIHSLVHRFILCGLFSFFFLCVCSVMLHTSVVVVAADDFNGFMRYINIHLKRAWEEKAADEQKCIPIVNCMCTVFCISHYLQQWFFVCRM